MTSRAIDRQFERHLAGPHQQRPEGRAAARAQGRRKGIAAGDAGRAGVAAPAPRGARLGAHQRAHHDRLLRGADRAGHAGLSRRAGNCCSTCATSTSSSTAHLGDELLWATSMPCAIGNDADIPIAQYGSSNIGRMKTIYREGLGLRYGRMMQAISGVHFNYSFPRTVLAGARRRCCESRQRRAGLHFGAVLRAAAQLPALRLDRAVPVRRLAGGLQVVPRRAATSSLPQLDAGTFYEPYATSLRMSDLGLSQQEPGGRRDLGQQPRGLRARSAARHLHAPCGLPAPRRQGERRIPPAQCQPAADRERVLQLHPPETRGAFRRAADQGAAARRRRVRRGSSTRCERIRSGRRQPEQAALSRSVPGAVPAQGEPAARRRASSASSTPTTSPWRGAGASPGSRSGAMDAATRCSRGRGRCCEEMQGICELLDAGIPARPYAAALAAQAAKVDDVALTPSARLMREMQTSGESFFQLALRMSNLHKSYFLELYPPNEQRLAELRTEAEESLRAQQADRGAGFDVLRTVPAALPRRLSASRGAHGSAANAAHVTVRDLSAVRRRTLSRLHAALGPEVTSSHDLG